MPDPIIIITPPKKPPNADLTAPGAGFIRGISVTSALVSAAYQVTNGVDLGYRIEVQ